MAFPPSGTLSLNRRHPRGRAVLVALPLLDGGGIQPVNLAGSYERYAYDGSGLTWNPTTKDLGPRFSGAGYISTFMPFPNGYAAEDGFTILATVARGTVARAAILELVGPAEFESGGPFLLVDDRVADVYYYFNGNYRIVSTALSAEVPTRLAITYDGADLNVFYNGVQEGATYSGASWPSSSNMRLNVGTGYWGKWTGNIGNVQMLGRALTVREVRDDFADPWAIYRPTPRLSARVPAAGGSTVGHYYRNHLMARRRA